MRIKLLAIALMLSVIAPSAAFACRCDTNNASRGEKLANDSSVTLVNVKVRGTNPRIGQSMLQLNETLHGGLYARDFRAKFATHSCGTVPQTGKNQTLAIKFEKNGTYSVMDSCDQLALKKHLNLQD